MARCLGPRPPKALFTTTYTAGSPPAPLQDVRLRAREPPGCPEALAGCPRTCPTSAALRHPLCVSPQGAGTTLMRDANGVQARLCGSRADAGLALSGLELELLVSDHASLQSGAQAAAAGTGSPVPLQAHEFSARLTGTVRRGLHPPLCAGEAAYDCGAGWLSSCPIGSGANSTCTPRSDNMPITFMRPFLIPPTVVLSLAAFDGCAARAAPHHPHTRHALRSGGCTSSGAVLDVCQLAAASDRGLLLARSYDGGSGSSGVQVAAVNITATGFQLTITATCAAQASALRVQHP
jgi:hypothetical protein